MEGVCGVRREEHALLWCTAGLRKMAGADMEQENRGQILEDYRSSEVKIPALANAPSVEMWQTHKHINFKARRDVKEGTFPLLFIQRLGIWVKFKNWDEIQGSCHLVNTCFSPVPRYLLPGIEATNEDDLGSSA